MLARNEAAPDRYLARVLARCAEFSDAILLLDDGSTDDTAQVARAAGCVVHTRDGAGFWGVTEAPARRELWERAAELIGDGWVLICDADMLLEGDPRPLCASWEAATWAWPLADLWDSESTFRVDGPWGFGPTVPRPWLFRPSAAPQDFVPRWPEKCVHTGHCPMNFGEVGPTFVAPPDVYWKHLSYLRREDRLRKHAQYASVTHQLSDFERAHAATILD
jgi:hypothetical protein